MWRLACRRPLLQRQVRASTLSRQLGCLTADDTSWAWLKDVENPRLQRFLKLERTYLANQMAKPTFRKVERTLYREMRHRLLRQDCSVPERIGEYEYFMRQAPGENFPVYYRRLLSGGADDELVLNQNVETALNQDFHVMAAMKLSPDATQLLLVMENDTEQCQVMLRDLKSNTLQLLKKVQGAKNVEWSSAPPPTRMFYYTKVDSDGRPYAVYRYNVATQAQELIYEEPNQAFFVDVSQTKDTRFILINCNSKNASEIYALESHDLTATPQLLRTREPGTLYFADHVSDTFYIVTNANGARNFQIATCTWHALTEWQVLVPAQDDVKIEDVDVFEKYLVLYERVNSIPRIRVGALTTQHTRPVFHAIPVPKEHELGRVTPGVNRDWHSSSVRFHLSTPLLPEIVFDYDMQHQKLHKRQETHVPHRSQHQKLHKRHETHVPHRSQHPRKSGVPPFDATQFVCTRTFVPSRTSRGVDIPLTLIHSRALTLNGQNPTLVIGYGAYGTNLEATFELEHLSLLERGWVVALAHVRGGGECGLQWYHAGKKQQKRHSFDDYVACTHYLVDARYTTPARLAGKGVSAGGLLMGFVANEYPQLYRALIMKVPFVDILATMDDATLPLTVHEYDEWGDPRHADVREYIRSYAPCENVVEHQVYPAMFVTGSLNDQRVRFWEPAKWMYKMRQVQAALPKRERRLMVLHMTQTDGHFGGSGRLEQLEESAREMAFLYEALDLPFGRK